MVEIADLLVFIAVVNRLSVQSHGEGAERRA